ncbi:MAG: acylphosphatase [Dehalococcoidales bacterium]|jgi:acylphosphatase|nr:acylphosphatase [Dehalococcoidales bacterium]
MNEIKRIHAIIHGRVQGVFFRAFVAQKARELNINGFVRNLPSGVDVEVVAEGEKKQLEKLIEFIKVGPPGARVEKVDIKWMDNPGKLSGFEIKY